MSKPFAHIRAHADARKELHRPLGNRGSMTEGGDYVGMRGEFAFGELVGLHPDTSARLGGDSGIDFMVPMLASVDVKTRKDNGNGKKRHLLVEAGKVLADIYVQAVLSEDETVCRCVGWVRAKDVKLYTPRDFGRGVLLHPVPEEDLLAMDLLTKRIHRWLDTVRT